MEEEEVSTSMQALALSPTTTSNNNKPPRRAILDGEIYQLFSLPKSIIYYIAMHPSNAEVYNKLIRCCKYFYNINPILVVNQVCFLKKGSCQEVHNHEDVSGDESAGGVSGESSEDVSGDNESSGDVSGGAESDESDSGDDEYDESVSSDGESSGSVSGDGESSEDDSDESDVNPLEHEDCKPGDCKYEWRIDFKKCCPRYGVGMNNVLPFKFWITGHVSIYPDDDKHDYAAADLAAKTYRCDANGFVLRHQVLTFDDFCLGASNSKEFLLNDVRITQGDGKTKMMFEKIVESLPNIRKMYWFDVTAWCQCHGVDERIGFSSATVTELLKIQHFGNVTELYLQGLPEAFDGKAIFDSIKMKHKNMKVRLEYDAPEISDHFKQQIDKIVDEVLSTRVFNYKPPYICYPGIDPKKSEKMLEIHSRH